MSESTQPWTVVAAYGAVWEAEFAAETLREAGIPAHVEGGANVGIFGPGYQGGSMFGVRVRVPWHRAEDARDLLDAVPMDVEEDTHSRNDEEDE